MRRESSKKVIKEAGHCQACMRVQMVRGRPGHYVLVQHGYKRPGHGWIVGGCMGVGYQPFERDNALFTLIRDRQIKSIPDYTKAIEDLTSGRRRFFLVDDHDKPKYSEETDCYGRKKHIGYEKKQISLDSQDYTEKRDAEYKRDRLIYALSQELQSLIAEIDWRTKTLAEWKLLPILEWDAYEEEKKRKGAPKDVAPDVGALLLKLARKSKSVVSFPVLKQALELLGWSAEPTVTASKPKQLYDIRENLNASFGPEVDFLTPTEHAIHVVFKTMAAARAAHGNLHVGKPPARKDRKAGDFYFEQAGPILEDARAYQHHPAGPGFAVWGVWQALDGAIFTSPDERLRAADTNEFSFTTDRYKGERRYDIVPQGFWTWAYRIGLNEAADAYLKAHATKPTIEGEADDEEGRLVEPAPLESFE